MKPHEIRRAWEDVAGNIDDPAYTMAGVSFAAGFLLGGDMPGSAALVIALAERCYGAGAPGLTDLKRKVGLAGPIERPEQDA